MITMVYREGIVFVSQEQQEAARAKLPPHAWLYQGSEVDSDGTLLHHFKAPFVMRVGEEWRWERVVVRDVEP
jgi:hypothetical protein